MFAYFGLPFSEKFSLGTVVDPGAHVTRDSVNVTEVIRATGACGVPNNTAESRACLVDELEHWSAAVTVTGKGGDFVLAEECESRESEVLASVHHGTCCPSRRSAHFVQIHAFDRSLGCVGRDELGIARVDVERPVLEGVEAPVECLCDRSVMKTHSGVVCHKRDVTPAACDAGRAGWSREEWWIPHLVSNAYSTLGEHGAFCLALNCRAMRRCIKTLRTLRDAVG